MSGLSKLRTAGLSTHCAMLAAMAGLGLTVIGENMASIAAAVRRQASVILTLILIIGGLRTSVPVQSKA